MDSSYGMGRLGAGSLPHPFRPQPPISADLQLAFLLHWPSSGHSPRLVGPWPSTQAPFGPGLWLHGTNSPQPSGWQAEVMARRGQRAIGNGRDDPRTVMTNLLESECPKTAPALPHSTPPSCPTQFLHRAGRVGVSCQQAAM